MHPQQLKSYLDRRPFRPFTVHVGDGDRVRVRSQEMVLLSPGGRTLVVFTGKHIGGDSEMKIIDVFLITQITTTSSNGHLKSR